MNDLHSLACVSFKGKKRRKKRNPIVRFAMWLRSIRMTWIVPAFRMYVRTIVLLQHALPVDL